MKGHRQLYWRKTRRLTFGLLAFWLCLTFGTTWFARDINQTVILGFPLGFYMAAQGALIIFLVIVWIYDRWMVRLERRHGLGGEG